MSDRPRKQVDLKAIAELVQLAAENRAAQTPAISAEFTSASPSTPASSKTPWPGGASDITAADLGRELARELGKDPLNMGKRVRGWLRAHPELMPGRRRGLPDLTHEWHLPAELANQVREAMGGRRR